MGLFNDFADLIGRITASVGDNMDNKEEDVFKVKKRLTQSGLYDMDAPPEPHGYVTAEMDTAIRGYQKERGLKVDGFLLPNGETERALMREEKRTQSQSPLNDSIFSFKNPFEQKEDSRPLEYDATGRMIRPEQSDRRRYANLPNIWEAKSEEKDLTPRPIMEFPRQKQEESEYDATGRMIREEKTPERKLTFWDAYLHYENGEGVSREISDKTMDSWRTMKSAMEENKKRFETSIVEDKIEGKPSVFKQKILSLKDGEEIVLNKRDVPGGQDYWDRDMSTKEAIKNRDISQALILGHVKLRSTGSIKVKRLGDLVYIDGLVEHGFKDVYDFNKEDKEFDGIRKRAEEGKADPYLNFGSKIEKMKGVIQIKDGKITDHKFHWQPVSKKDLRNPR